MKHQSQAFKLWFSKHWSNFCGIGKKMKMMGYWKDDLCPCCKKVPETSTTHLFLCDNLSITSTRNSEFQKILQWLHKVDTDPTLIHIISSFWHGKQPDLSADEPYIYRLIYESMQEMGVASMWMGLIPKKLCTQQHT